jgi:hypothetical protein
MRETWYILEDGTPADPAHVAPDESGRLVHKNGMAVAVGPYGPRSTGVDPDEERAKAEAVADPEPGTVKAEAVAERPRRPYKTRGGRG